MDWVDKDDVVVFIRNLVTEELDLREILDGYHEERGYPPFHPVMMTALLLYSYCQRIYSSRRIATGCKQRVDFLALTGMQQPDHRTVRLLSIMLCLRTVYRLPSNRAWNIALSCGRTEWMR